MHLVAPKIFLQFLCYTQSNNASVLHTVKRSNHPCIIYLYMYIYHLCFNLASRDFFLDTSFLCLSTRGAESSMFHVHLKRTDTVENQQLEKFVHKNYFKLQTSQNIKKFRRRNQPDIQYLTHFSVREKNSRTQIFRTIRDREGQV
jgi:hypothetical protein